MRYIRLVVKGSADETCRVVHGRGRSLLGDELVIRMILGLGLVLEAGYGGMNLVAPEIFSGVSGLVAENPEGTAEIRATLGGIHLGIGALLGLALINPALRPGALAAGGFVFAGLVIGRLAGVVLDQAWGAFTRGALMYDTVVTGLFVAGFLRDARDTRERGVEE